MTEGILQRLPDLATLQQSGTAATGDANALLGRLTVLQGGQDGSPIASVTRVLNELDQRLNIDVSGLTSALPNALTVVKNTIPEGTLEQIRAIEEAYTAAQDFLQNSAIAQQVREGSSLQAVALAVVEDALRLFSSRLGELTINLIPSDLLEEVQTVFSSLDAFQSSFPTHQSEFIPFLTNHLIGVAPDLLQQPLAHLDTIYDVVLSLDSAALETTFGNPQRTIATTFQTLIQAIDTLDPNNPDHYQLIQAQLDAAESSIQSLVSVLQTFYQSLDSAIASFDWQGGVTIYANLLGAIQITPILSVDQVVDSIGAVLEQMLSRLYLTLGVEDLTQRVDALSQVIRDTFTNSGLGQIRQTLRHFLEQIRDAIAAVPTEEIQQLVEKMLGQVHQALESLGITQITNEIEQAFTDLETFITSNINNTLTNDVRTALAQVLSEVRSLPVADVVAELSRGISDLMGLVQELETALQGYMQDFTDFVSQLDELSFKPLSDEVIAEIEALKTRLQAINPNALSDAEKFALKAALAVLEGIDLEGQVINGLNSGFGELQGQVKQLLAEITASLNRLKDQLGDLDPNVILKPTGDLLDQATKQVNRLNGTLVMRPIYDLSQQLVDRLNTLSPGQLLDPLQAPYDEMMSFVNRLSPSEWVAPLNVLYEQIDRLISYVDVTPLLEELDRQQKQLFADARTAIFNALQGLNLPEPLDEFWEGIRAILEGFTDAIFGDPETSLKQFSINLKTQFKLSSLFEPLDLVFNRLVAMLESVPQESLTEAMNTIRQSLGLGLDLLDPSAIRRRLRQGVEQLGTLSPAVQLSYALKLPALKQAFELKVSVAPSSQSSAIATISGKFDAVFAIVSPEISTSAFQPLQQSHQRLVRTMRSQVNQLDFSHAEAAYLQLKSTLEALLPDFLRQPTPLTYGEILNGIYALRPSNQVSRIDSLLDRFLQQLQPLENALEPAVNNFFSGIRDTIMLVNPLSLKDSVAEIYDTIRAKVRILDPEALATHLQNDILEPLLAPLAAIDPRKIRDQINTVYESTITALSQGVRRILDDISAAIDELLGNIRAEIQGLITQIKTAIQTVAQSVQDIVNRVEQLVFVEVLDRLNRVVDNLGVSFSQELNRVRSAFDAMLAAIPLSSSSGSTGASLAA